MGGENGGFSGWQLVAAAAAAAWCFLLVQCGGHAREDAQSGAPNGSTSGQAGGMIADASFGGSNGGGGGMSSDAGTSSLAGSSGASPCGELKCPPGTRVEMLPDFSCPVCFNGCVPGGCEATGCAENLRYVDALPSDLCCSICESDGSGTGTGGEAGAPSATSCDDATAAYQTYQQSLLTDDVLACESDEDCGLVNAAFACGSNCVFAVNRQHQFDVADALTERASETCSQCRSPSPRVCPPFAFPICRGHRCIDPAN